MKLATFMVIIETMIMCTFLIIATIAVFNKAWELTLYSYLVVFTTALGFFRKWIEWREGKKWSELKNKEV